MAAVTQVRILVTACFVDLLDGYADVALLLLSICTGSTIPAIGDIAQW